MQLMQSIVMFINKMSTNQLSNLTKHMPCSVIYSCLLKRSNFLCISLTHVCLRTLRCDHVCINISTGEVKISSFGSAILKVNKSWHSFLPSFCQIIGVFVGAQITVFCQGVVKITDHITCYVT